MGISLLTGFRSWEWATRSIHVKHCVDVGFYLSGLKPASVVAGYRVGLSLDFLSLTRQIPNVTVAFTLAVSELC